MYNCATYVIFDIFSSNFKSNPYIKYVQNCKFGPHRKNFKSREKVRHNIKILISIYFLAAFMDYMALCCFQAYRLGMK